MRLGAVLGGVAEGYLKTQKQEQELKIQKQEADYAEQQRKLALQFQSEQNNPEYQSGVTVGAVGNGTSVDYADLAKNYGATDAQIAAAKQAAANGDMGPANALLSTLGMQAPPAQAGLPANGPAPGGVQHITVHPGDIGYFAPPDGGPVGVNTTGAPVTVTPNAAPNSDYTTNTIAAESSGNPAAYNSGNGFSHAGGLGQFEPATWRNTLAAHAPQLVAGKTPEQIDAMRMDTSPAGQALQKQAIGWLAQDNAKLLQDANQPVTPTTVGLAHRLGAGAAIAALKSPPNTPLTKILPPDAIAANPQYAKMTTGQLAAQIAQEQQGSAVATPAGLGATATSVSRQAPPDQQATVFGVQPNQYGKPSEYAGNVYMTPMGLRATTTPKKRTPGEAAKAIAQRQLDLRMMDTNGRLVGLQNMTDAENLIAQEQKDTEVQREQDREVLQAGVQKAGNWQELANAASQSGLNGHFRIISNDNNGNAAVESVDPTTGVTVMVSQGSFAHVKDQLLGMLASPATYHAMLQDWEKMTDQAVRTQAAAYQAQAQGTAALANAGSEAAKTPSTIGVQQAQAGALTAQAGETQANTAKINEELGVESHIDQAKGEVANAQTPEARQAAVAKLNAWSGLTNPKLTPLGNGYTQIEMGNGQLLVAGPDMHPVPAGNDYRVVSADPDVKAGKISLGWYKDNTSGAMVYGFRSTAPAYNPQTGQWGIAASPQLADVKTALQQRPPKPKVQTAPKVTPTAPFRPGQSLTGDVVNAGLGAAGVEQQAAGKALGLAGRAAGYVFGLPQQDQQHKR